MKTKMSDRQYCTKCGGHLMNNHPPLGLVDVYAATIPSVKFVPVVHVNYAETVLPMKDGLPKLKDSQPRWAGQELSCPNSNRRSQQRKGGHGIAASLDACGADPLSLSSQPGTPVFRFEWRS